MILSRPRTLLCRDPYLGVQLGPHSRVWFLSVTLPKAKPVGSYYAFDEDVVHFLSITPG